MRLFKGAHDAKRVILVAHFTRNTIEGHLQVGNIEINYTRYLG